jgi:hypothetical protein
MNTHCRNTRCRDWLDDGASLGFCPSCRLAIALGVGTGAGVCAALGCVFGLVEWLWSG